MTSPIISDDALATYREDGFAALREFFSAAEIAEIRENLDRVIAEIVPGLPPEVAFYEDREEAATLKQIQHLEQHDPFFGNLFAGRFETLASTLLEDEVIGKNLQYFNKPPAVGQPTPPHQDGYYFMLDPCEAVTMWLALEEVDEENGCVRYVSGSHRREMRPHGRTGTLGFSQGITDFPSENDRAREIPIPAAPGDLLVHHAKTIHRADGNQSQTRSRRALGAVFFAARAKQDIAAQTAYQEKLNRELAAEGKI
jgi:phytanoyl-CoA hydroxylase